MVDKTPYVQRLQQIYKEKYQIEVTDEEAWDYFERLLTLYQVVYGILPEDEFR